MQVERDTVREEGTVASCIISRHLTIQRGDIQLTNSTHRIIIKTTIHLSLYTGQMNSHHCNASTSYPKRVNKSTCAHVSRRVAFVLSLSLSRTQSRWSCIFQLFTLLFTSCIYFDCETTDEQTEREHISCAGEQLTCEMLKTSGEWERDIHRHRETKTSAAHINIEEEEDKSVNDWCVMWH